MEKSARLHTEQNIWLATVRGDGRPHLVPIWFVWVGEKFYICTEANSVKGRNLSARPVACLALEDGINPVVAECQARRVEPPYPPEIVSAFYGKYEWQIDNETQYNTLFELAPNKWLMEPAASSVA